MRSRSRPSSAARPSTGIYGYPREEAARVAVDATREALTRLDTIELVRFVLFDEETRRVYEHAVAAGRS